MKLIIAAASIYMPEPLKRKKLEELFARTAEAFGCGVPSVRGLSYDELLRSYAGFTSAHANQALRRDQGSHSAAPRREVIAITPEPGANAGSGLRDEAIPSLARQGEIARETLLAMTERSDWDSSGGDLAEIRGRLYDGAYRMGQDLRRTFRVANIPDALAAARVLYRALGIDLQAAGGGEIVIRRCYFSQYYSSAVCQVIASLDEGLFAGLSNGGELAFYRRITAGYECCRAHFRESS
jgi:hypothetical protein